MNRSHSTLPALFLVLSSLALLPAGTAPALAQPEERPPSPSYEDEPGFVDFERLGLVAAEGDESLRISLYGPILQLVAEATKGEEPGFSEVIAKLRGIRADLFQVPPPARNELRRRTVDTARRLERRGWQTVVEVRSDSGDLSFIQTKTDGDRISGLSVMFLEPDGSAGFINIVGDVSPAELGRLGRTFDIEPLQELDREMGDELDGRSETPPEEETP